MTNSIEKELAAELNEELIEQLANEPEEKPTLTPKRITKVNSKTARMFGKILDRHPEFTQHEIKLAMGMAPNSNMLSQIRKGRSKMPLNRIVEFCKLLNEDPVPLVKCALEEYHGEALKAFQLISGTVVDEDEREFLSLYREVKEEATKEAIEEERQKYIDQCYAERKPTRDYRMREIATIRMKLTEDRKRRAKIQNLIKDEGFDVK